MIIADSGFFIALFNKSDRHHHRALKALAALSDEKEPLITTWPVLTETTYFLLKRLDMKAVELFFKQVSLNIVHVFEIPRSEYEQIVKLMRKYKELPMDLADASLVILAESLGEGRILSTDMRDFKTYRWKNRKPFTNILLS